MSGGRLQSLPGGRTLRVGSGPRRTEQRHTFACFGGECTVIVADVSRSADAAAAAAMAQHALLTWHQRFSRFEDGSELSRLNRAETDPVSISPLMRRVLEVALAGARETGGLVDPTLVTEIEEAGYASHLEGEGIPLVAALRMAPPRAPAAPHPDERWRRVELSAVRGTVSRPPAVRIDVGGIAKGVFADELSAMLGRFDCFALDCAGDLRVGGSARIARDVQIANPFHPGTLHTFQVTDGAVATSGIGRRSWLGADGRPAHHLLDPRTGAPAFTGIVQATALAPTAAQAEILAKAALLSGPGRAREWLPHGGLIVLDDGTHQVLGPPGAGSPQTSTGPARISWNRPA